MSEEAARKLATVPHDQARALALSAFAGWAPPLIDLVRDGDVLAARPLYALPIGHRWKSRRGVTLLGDAAHLMSPFSGEGVNLALADAVDLADALTSGNGRHAVKEVETTMSDRATPAAEGAVGGLESVFSAAGAAPVLEHYLERVRLRAKADVATT